MHQRGMWEELCLEQVLVGVAINTRLGHDAEGIRQPRHCGFSSAFSGSGSF